MTNSLTEFHNTDIQISLFGFHECISRIYKSHTEYSEWSFTTVTPHKSVWGGMHRSTEARSVFTLLESFRTLLVKLNQPMVRHNIDKPSSPALTECSLWSSNPRRNAHIRTDYAEELSNNAYNDYGWFPWSSFNNWQNAATWSLKSVGLYAVTYSVASLREVLNATIPIDKSEGLYARYFIGGDEFLVTQSLIS
jgi:hypothetical protein